MSLLEQPLESTYRGRYCGQAGAINFAFLNRMTPETRAMILRDFKTGKAKSASELGRLHGVSRSAVYRVLKTVKAADTEAGPVQRRGADTETRIVDSEDLVPKDMLEKMETFANDLGLPMEGSNLRHDAEEKTPAEREADERELDRVMGRIVGDGGSDPLDGFMSQVFEAPPQREVVARGQRIVLEPPEPEIDREDIKQRIIFNVEHFAPHLKTITGENREAFLQSLGGRSSHDLQGLLTTIERTRSVGNLAAGFKQMFYVVGQAVETGTRVIGMRTQGFSERLQEHDEEVTMCLKEIAINEWERLKAFDSPQIRLGSLFCLTLIQTDSRNRMNDQVRRVVQAPVNPSVAAANEDL